MMERLAAARSLQLPEPPGVLGAPFDISSSFIPSSFLNVTFLHLFLGFAVLAHGVVFLHLSSPYPTE